MKIAALCLATLSLLVSLVQGDEIVDYENPIRTSVEDEIKSLPYLNEAITFRQYSGYLKADRGNKKFLHYWFVEASDDPTNKPVLLWLNGGPGCSSMEGLFSELGPFKLNSNATDVKLRKYSWNKLANVIFLESPAGVGFSYSTKRFNSETDDSAAQENYLALKDFYEKYPQYKSNPLYLSGESYAGVYLPTLGVLVDADKDLNLKGIAIGNGYLDAQKLEESLIYFSYYHGLFGKSTWELFSKECCGGKPPARENCEYDRACAYGILEKISQVLSEPGFNPYNMYGDCPTSNLSTPVTSLNEPFEPSLSRRSIDSAMRKIFMDRGLENSQSKPFEILKLDSRELVAEPPCFDGDGMLRYLNKPEVRDAIHIPKRLGRWEACRNLNYAVKYPIRRGGLSPQIKQLINSERKLALLVFNGDTDLVCNALGDEWFVDDLGRKVIVDYSPWKVDKQIAGFVKHYDGITYATVRGAGHMVPEFRPKEAFAMIKAVFNSTNHNVLL